MGDAKAGPNEQQAKRNAEWLAARIRAKETASSEFQTKLEKCVPFRSQQLVKGKKTLLQQERRADTSFPQRSFATATRFVLAASGTEQRHQETTGAASAAKPPAEQFQPALNGDGEICRRLRSRATCGRARR